MSDDDFAPFERDKPDHMETVRHIAEAHTEHLLAGSFTPALMFMDDNEEPRTIVFPDIDGTDEARYQLAWAMKVIAAAIDDLWSIAFVADTYHTTSKRHDGSDWGPGGMQHAFENKTADADLVQEALTYQMIAGDHFYVITVPYERANGAIEFQWDDVMTMDESDGAQLGGFYPDSMREAYSAPKVLAIPEAVQMMTALGLDMDTARLHGLCAAVKMVLAQVGIPALIPCRDENEVELLRTSFAQEPDIAMFDKQEVEEISSLEQQFRLHSEEE